MSRWKRKGLLVYFNKYDHEPKHVHVYKNRKEILKFDIESWKKIKGRLSRKARKVLEQLRAEGRI